MNRSAILGIVIPCYNEEEVIESTVKTLQQVLEKLITDQLVSAESFIGLVDDRSKDHTWQIIQDLVRKEKRLKAIRLASNKGHQYALFAGLMEFNEYADCIISMDADLQDDIGVLDDMIQKFYQGNQIVYGVRKNRENDTLLKRMTAILFYRLFRLFDKQAIFNHADFRLAGRKVVDELKKFSEVNLFLRGIFPLIGFDTAIVYYDRKKRLKGTSKYPFKKMISLALDGITSFSTVPLRVITFTGFIVFLICLILIAYALISYINHKTVPGWFSTVLPFYFLGGIQILCIGIIGEYLGKIYKEVKRRPRYIVDEKL